MSHFQPALTSERLNPGSAGSPDHEEEAPRKEGEPKVYGPGGPGGSPEVTIPQIPAHDRRPVE